MAERLRDPHDIAFTKILSAGFHVIVHEPEQAAELSRSCIELSKEYALEQEERWASMWLGRALVDLGEVDEGLDLMRRSLDAQRERNARVSVTSYLSLLAEGLLIAGEISEGLAVVEEALELVRTTGESFCEAEILSHQRESVVEGTRECCSVPAARRRKLSSSGLDSTCAECEVPGVACDDGSRAALDTRWP